MTTEHDGHRERLKTRAEKTNLQGFQPHEVLELILMETIPRKDVNPLAHILLSHFGNSFAEVLDAKKEQLMEVPGIGEATARHIAGLRDLFAYYQKDRWSEKPQLSTHGEAGEYCCALFGRQREESLKLVCLDVQLVVLAVETLSEGTLDATRIEARQIVECAIRHNAHSVILAHNHPSGVLNPSREDMDATRQVELALRTIDVRLLDHFIVAGSQYRSIRDVIRELETMEMELVAEKKRKGKKK